jgi:hypothetical protein
LGESGGRQRDGDRAEGRRVVQAAGRLNAICEMRE